MSGVLRQQIRAAADASGLSLCSLTVLSVGRDPYRIDTPAGHRDAQWFAEQFKRAGRSQIHLRGLHYSIVARKGVLKPNGFAVHQ